MIKAICDKCGKESTLLYTEFGLRSPSGWKIETQYNALQNSYDYRACCPECNPRKVTE